MKGGGGGSRGAVELMVSILASGPRSPRFKLLFSQKNSEEKIVNVAEVNKWRCLEVYSVQWLELFIKPI